ncbi:type VI secretion system Vgr family protein [Flexibacterium corallicola]|uniref:type VI secretion system Vgr family protein n=1 Tax=Flexibacterium corallicola TaxID=3037259 RepID=UPI00286F4661|nr:type VI secretion system tip protein TssI/VgrG [Pseudovibrio sp. M1P-2-3]
MSMSLEYNSDQISILSVDGQELAVQGVQLEERICEVPTYNILALDTGQSLQELVGQKAELSFVETAYSKGVIPRKFAGLVFQADRIIDSTGLTQLSIVVRPKLGVLELGEHCAIYQNKSTLDIWGEVFERNGIGQVKTSGAKTSGKRETCIQYNENDLSFCQRILAEEGLVYFVSDGSDPEALVIHDPSKPFPAQGGAVELEDMLGVTAPGAYQAITLEHSQVMRPATTELATYDADTAKTLKAGPKPSSSLKTIEKPVVYRFLPLPRDTLSSVTLGKMTQSVQGYEVRVRGTCEHPSLHIGQAIKLNSNVEGKLPQTLIITALSYKMERGLALQATIEAVPEGTPIVPKYIPKPLIAGVHNAVVVGPKVGEPACDEQGRVKLQFFWDISGRTEDTSGYIRVAEIYAGNGTGTQFLPRVGHEVLVSFLHGDPDLPIISGQIYNEKNKPPFIAKNTTKSGIRSQLGDLPNELEFDDKVGAELIGLRAAKDFELLVEENVNRNIKKLETTTVGESSKIVIGKDLLTEVESKTELKTSERSVETTNTDSLQAKEIELSADTKLTLKVGSSKIEMSSSEIKISATTVSVSGQSKVSAKSSGTLEMKGLTAKLEADTKTEVKGLQVAVEAQAQVSIKGPLAEVNSQGPLMIKGMPAMIN